MPQFWLEDFAPQLVWLAITFAVFYLLMSRVALPRVAEVLEDRQNRIAGDLDRAEQLKGEAGKVIADYEAALAVARGKAQATLAAAAAAATAELDKRGAEINDRLAGEAEAAAGRIAEAKQAAMTEVRGVAIELAQAVSDKLAGAGVVEADVARAVDTAMEAAG